MKPSAVAAPRPKPYDSDRGVALAGFLLKIVPPFFYLATVVTSVVCNPGIPWQGHVLMPFVALLVYPYAFWVWLFDVTVKNPAARLFYVVLLSVVCLFCVLTGRFLNRYWFLLPLGVGLLLAALGASWLCLVQDLCKNGLHLMPFR
jgi:hypothetical protein